MPLVSQARDLDRRSRSFAKSRSLSELATSLSTVQGGVSGDPTLPPLPILLPFPGIAPGHGGGFTFRPGHDHRITPAG